MKWTTALFASTVEEMTIISEIVTTITSISKTGQSKHMKKSAINTNNSNNCFNGFQAEDASYATDERDEACRPVPAPRRGAADCPARLGYRCYRRPA